MKLPAASCGATASQSRSAGSSTRFHAKNRVFSASMQDVRAGWNRRARSGKGVGARAAGTPRAWGRPRKARNQTLCFAGAFRGDEISVPTSSEPLASSATSEGNARRTRHSALQERSEAMKYRSPLQLSPWRAQLQAKGMREGPDTLLCRSVQRRWNIGPHFS